MYDFNTAGKDKARPSFRALANNIDLLKLGIRASQQKWILYRDAWVSFEAIINTFIL